MAGGPGRAARCRYVFLVDYGRDRLGTAAITVAHDLTSFGFFNIETAAQMEIFIYKS
jgi:hypothetical protein